jgi:neutral ceramidase
MTGTNTFLITQDELRSGIKSLAGFIWLLLVVLVIIPCSTACAATETEYDRVFMAGAATLDITSPLGTPVVGGWQPAPAVHVNDPLNVRVLALNDGETTLVFAVCDLLGIPQELSVKAKELIKQQSDLPPSHVVITGTHTHSAGTPFSYNGDSRSYRPDGELNSYQLFVAKRIADAVQIAINNLEPAQIGWGSGSEPSQVFNRRWFVDAEEIRRNPFGGVDKVRMNPPTASPELIEPAGPTDPEIVFISVQSKDGRPVALFANYSLHYVGGIPAATISADYFGVFSDRIQELIGADRQDPPFVGILSNGTSGDINNNNYAVSRESSEPYERMHEVADLVATEVHRAYQNIDYQDWVKLDARYEEIFLQRRETTDDMIAYAHEILDRPEDVGQWHNREATYANRVLNLAGTPETWNMPLQAFRIGDLGVAAIPAEVFVEIGLEIKEKSPFASSFTLSLANGYEGYLPTVEQHELGGYETWTGTSRLEIEAAPKIIDVLLNFLNDME